MNVISLSRKNILRLVFLISITGALCIGNLSCVGRSRLSFLPEPLKVSKIIYAEEKHLGIGGPGDNEAGLIVYELPEEIAEEIKKDKLDFFSKMNKILPSGSEWKKWSDDGWQETPILENQDWDKEIPIEIRKTLVPRNQDWFIDPAYDKRTPNPQIRNYLDRHGPKVSVKPDIEQEINSTISKPGAYFGYSRMGVVIIAPEIGKVFFAYN